METRQYTSYAARNQNKDNNRDKTASEKKTRTQPLGLVEDTKRENKKRTNLYRDRK